MDLSIRYRGKVPGGSEGKKKPLTDKTDLQTGREGVY